MLAPLMGLMTNQGKVQVHSKIVVYLLQLANTYTILLNYTQGSVWADTTLHNIIVSSSQCHNTLKISVTTDTAGRKKAIQVYLDKIKSGIEKMNDQHMLDQILSLLIQADIS